MKEDNNDAYLEGWNSYYSGISEKENPYKVDLEDGSNYMEWEYGWIGAFQEATGGSN